MTKCTLQAKLFKLAFKLGEFLEDNAGKEFTEAAIKEHFLKESHDDLKSALDRLVQANFLLKIVQKTTSTRETCIYRWLANIEDINDQSGHTSEADDEDESKDDKHSMQRDCGDEANELAALRAENSQLKMHLAVVKADLALFFRQDEIDENLDEVYLILMQTNHYFLFTLHYTLGSCQLSKSLPYPGSQ